MIKRNDHTKSYKKLNPNMRKATFDKYYTTRVSRDNTYFLFQWMYKERSNGSTTYCVMLI